MMMMMMTREGSEWHWNDRSIAPLHISVEKILIQNLIIVYLILNIPVATIIERLA
jgi:hypothetical protein